MMIAVTEINIFSKQASGVLLVEDELDEAISVTIPIARLTGPIKLSLTRKDRRTLSSITKSGKLAM